MARRKVKRIRLFQRGNFIFSSRVELYDLFSFGQIAEIRSSFVWPRIRCSESFFRRTNVVILFSGFDLTNFLTSILTFLVEEKKLDNFVCLRKTVKLHWIVVSSNRSRKLNECCLTRNSLWLERNSCRLFQRWSPSLVSPWLWCSSAFYFRFSEINIKAIRTGKDKRISASENEFLSFGCSGFLFNDSTNRPKTLSRKSQRRSKFIDKKKNFLVRWSLSKKKEKRKRNVELSFFVVVRKAKENQKKSFLFVFFVDSMNSIRRCVEQQLNEIELIRCCYSSNDEFFLDDAEAMTDAKDFVDGKIENPNRNLSFVLKVRLNEKKVKRRKGKSSSEFSLRFRGKSSFSLSIRCFILRRRSKFDFELISREKVTRKSAKPWKSSSKRNSMPTKRT